MTTDYRLWMSSATVDVALRLALREMRKELRWMLETGADASRDTPPRMDNLDATERRMISEVLEAIRACSDCLGGKMPPDGQPWWLDDVIEGRLA